MYKNIKNFKYITLWERLKLLFYKKQINIEIYDDGESVVAYKIMNGCMYILKEDFFRV